jgi:hypothetical protein
MVFGDWGPDRRIAVKWTLVDAVRRIDRKTLASDAEMSIIKNKHQGGKMD